MKKQRSKRIVFAFLAIVIVWQIAAMIKDNELLIPYPYQVVTAMLKQVRTYGFYKAVLATLYRTLVGLGISFICALGSAYACFRYKIINDLCYPFLLLTRSIPNISYILIVLVLFSRAHAVLVILFLILFPIMHAHLYEGFQSMDQALLDVLKLYPPNPIFHFLHVYLPLLKPVIKASLTSGISLAFKVGVMAEILGGMQNGIGRELNLCRLNFDMISMFAWTIWMIFLLVLMDRILSFIFRE